jgi:ACS family hexuronate transporter-like MFS transporter
VAFSASYERHWRWWVLGALFAATFLSYLDRQTLGTAAKPMLTEFGLGQADPATGVFQVDRVVSGRLLAAFLYAYAAAHLIVGFVLDRVRNIRRFYAIVVVGWSVSNMLVGFARSYTDVLWLRGLLGLWEAASFPLCLLLVARIFPHEERSFAAGLFNSGAVIASLATPSLVVYLSTRYDWRFAFILTGAIGVAWLVPWLLIFRRLEARAPDLAPQALAAVPRQSVFADAATVLRSPAFWGVALMGIGIIPGWYFVANWLPLYFTEALGMDYGQAMAGRLTLVYLFQSAGLWAGGGLVWVLARRGRSVVGARRAVIVGSFVLMLPLFLLPLVRSVPLTVVLLCLYSFGLAAWQANLQAFKQDVSVRHVGTVAALVGFLETGFAAFVVQGVGEIAHRTGGFSAVFALLGAFFSVGLAALFVLIRPQWLDLPPPGRSPATGPPGP